MATDTIYMKQGDRLPRLHATLTANGSPVDLTGASVTLFWKEKNTGDPIGFGACTIIDAEDATVSYEWADGDTDVPGKYILEIVASWDGKEMTFPNTPASLGSLKMVITADIDESD